MKTILILAGCVAALTSLWQSADAAIVVTSTRTLAADPVPTISTTDLGQTAFASSTHSDLFNGLIGDTNSPTSGSAATTIAEGGTITLNLDTTVNVLGYDITGIDTFFGWNTPSNGRSNQGYQVELGFVLGGTATLASNTVWEPNATPAQFWTEVSFVNDGGGTLIGDTIELNGGGAGLGTGVIATGVNSISWTNIAAANAGGVVVAREFDVFGTATGAAAVPEPSSIALLGLAVVGLMVHRRK